MWLLLEGFYKVRFQVDEAVGRSVMNGRWKGEILNQEHTPARSEHPVFGGHEVGIGFSGTCDDRGALLEATALAGKRSLRLTAVLKLMRRA
jgi:hypothetical protein